MSALTRFKTAFTLMKDSLLLMRHHPRLFLFPIVSSIAGIAFMAVFIGFVFGGLALQPEGGNVLMASLIIALLVVYLITTFVSVFFTAGLVHQTREALGGNAVSLRAGMAGAWDVKMPLFIWALISATIGVILSSIEDSNSGVARIIGTLFGLAWTLLTFLIIPVIVFEEPSVREMFRSSAESFRDTWGETPISLAGVGVLSLAVALPFAGPGIVLLESTGFSILGFGLIATGAVLGAIVSQTFKGVIKTSLYFYATDGTLPAEFDDIDPTALARDQPTTGSNATSGMSGGLR